MVEVVKHGFTITMVCPVVNQSTMTPVYMAPYQSNIAFSCPLAAWTPFRYVTEYAHMTSNRCTIVGLVVDRITKRFTFEDAAMNLFSFQISAENHTGTDSLIFRINKPDSMYDKRIGWLTTIR